jgi:Tol biopolymer transport system component
VHGGNLYLWTPGSHPRRLTSGPDPKDWPQWSPDGKLIAFSMAPGWNGQGTCGMVCRFEIWVVHANGSGARQLTTDGEEGGVAPDACCTDQPSWSPDGRKLVFVREFGDSPSQLVLISVQAGKETPLNAFGVDPVWGRHGIAFSGRGGIHLYNPETRRAPLLVRTQIPQITLAWSPAGGELAAILTPASRQLPYQAPQKQRIAIYSSSGRRITSFNTPVRTGHTLACGVSWSPDGRNLLVTVSPITFDGAKNPYTSLYEVAATGKDWHAVSQRPSTCHTSWR